MADETLEERVPDLPDPGERRVKKRAGTPASKENEADDTQAQARALLSESDARTDDPAAGRPGDPRVEHRTSDEATPPVEEG